MDEEASDTHIGQDTDQGQYDLLRRDSKRRRLLWQRVPEDRENSELQWSAAQHAPNFFGVTASKPNRMNDNTGLAPEQTLPNWSQPQPQSDALAYETSQPYSSNGQPYFYSQQSTPAFAPQSWSDASLQDTYGLHASPYPALTPAHDQAISVKFQSGAQYLDPHGGSEAIYNTSDPNSYASSSSFSNPFLSQGQSYLNDAMSVTYTERQPSITQTLANIEQLSTQIIQLAAQTNHADFQELLKGNTAESQRFLASKSAFTQARRLLAGEQAFIDAADIQNFSPFQQDIVRRANTATFIMSVMGDQSVSFYSLDRLYLETFVPLGHRLLKWQGTLFLELKTQTYILSVQNVTDPPIDASLDELFPVDLEAHVLSRHPDAPSLSPSEQDFVDRCKARRQYLLAESYTDEKRSELPKRYQWTDFVKEFSNCISKNVEHILSPSHRQSAMHGVFNRRRAGSGPIMNDNASAKSDVRRSISSGGGQDKRSSTNGQTVRQAWTKFEEEALIAGLEHVGGPHWSQILALYGRGGSVSEVLKDRNQVQLKDKARNLKLWYLKMGQEVPASLRGVTGELRKRGGARARAALEAEEQSVGKERRSSDEAESSTTDLDPGLKVRHDTVDPAAYDRTRTR